MTKRKSKRGNTVKRHRMVFYNYLRIIKGYGEEARGMSKSFLYEKAGEPFGYEWETAGKIVRDALRNGDNEIRKYLTKAEEQELVEVMDALAR